MAGRTHFVVVVVIDGQRFLCDPGFGMSLLWPIPMEDGAEVDCRGWRYRLHRSTATARCSGSCTGSARAAGS